jgi:hypothetical protein
MKKIWEKPELIVLFKGKPEDFVLTGCKSESGPTSGAQGVGGVCKNNYGAQCSSYNPS